MNDFTTPPDLTPEEDELANQAIEMMRGTTFEDLRKFLVPHANRQNSYALLLEINNLEGNVPDKAFACISFLASMFAAAKLHSKGMYEPLVKRHLEREKNAGN